MASLPLPALAGSRVAPGAPARWCAGWLATTAVLLKARIVAMVVFTGLVAAYVAAHGQVAPMDLAFFTLASSLGAGGAAVLNHYVDRDLDARMARTRGRPLPAGQVRPSAALLLGLALLGLSLPVSLRVHPALPFFILQGAFVYVVIYTWWLKRRTPHSVIIGGWTGSCAVLGGWAMTGAPLSLSAWALAAVIFLWTPPHFWALALVRDADFRAAGVPTLPATAGEATTVRAIVLSAALTVLVSLVPWQQGDLGPVYAFVAAVSGAAFTARAAALRRRVSVPLAWRTYKLSGTYLLTLFLAMVADVALR